MDEPWRFMAERARSQPPVRMTATGRRHHHVAGRRWLIGLCAANLGLLIGCAGHQPSTHSTLTAGRQAYTRLQESLAIDTGALAGRVIVIDPGHGGGYRGAHGNRGLAEADVNLAVSLFLWGMLQETGAHAVLTRGADRDFLVGDLQPPAMLALPGEMPTPPVPGGASPDSLRRDLQARVELANATGADLFLAIHHNADASGDTTRNQTQTFYRLGDDGPSLDAAQAIHRHLMINLGTTSGRVLPGNYHVLRESTAPAAVLGEASYLTNPLFEKRLVRIDRVELEATAYFLGILDYFRAGIARVVELAPADTVLAAAQIQLEARIAGSPVDPASVTMHVDGQPLAVSRIGGGDRYAGLIDYPLHAGPHRLEVRGYCLGGNAVPTGVARFEVRRPIASIRLEQRPAWSGAGEPGPLALRVMVADQFGLPIADGSRVRLLEPTREEATTLDGEAWFYLEDDQPLAPSGVWIVEGVEENLSEPFRSGSAGASDGASETASETARAETAADAATVWSGWVRQPAGGAIAGARLHAPHGGVLGTSNRDGFFAVLAPAPGGAEHAAAGAAPATLVIEAPGYLSAGWTSQPSPHGRRWRPTALADPSWSEAPVLEPQLGGVLLGRRIAIDPAGGGAEPLFLGQSGLRGAELTLAVARLVTPMLAAAGAEPLLIRRDERTLPDLARIEASEAFGAERYLRIGLTQQSSRVRHYPGSPHGRALARAVAASLVDLAPPREPLAVSAQVTPVLLHTSCPAVELLVQFTDPGGLQTTLGSVSWRQALARALVLALAEEFGYDLMRAARLEVQTDRPLLIDRSWVALPEAGSIRLRGLEPAPARHRLESLHAAGDSASDRSAVLDLQLAPAEIRHLDWSRVTARGSGGSPAP